MMQTFRDSEKFTAGFFVEANVAFVLSSHKLFPFFLTILSIIEKRDRIDFSQRYFKNGIILCTIKFTCVFLTANQTNHLFQLYKMKKDISILFFFLYLSIFCKSSLMLEHSGKALGSLTPADSSSVVYGVRITRFSNERKLSTKSIRKAINLDALNNFTCSSTSRIKKD